MTSLRLHHLSLRVRSAPASAAFYRDAFQFAERRALSKPDGSRILHLAAPDASVLLEVIEGEPVDPGEAVHLGFSCADLDGAIAGACAAGAEVARGPLEVGRERIVFLRDPDGYWIELNDGLEP
ncbi:MAG TPA: VOC family protein [Kofleriaceae bacterium]|nr:VOC family protein [Kofleriaceae bacterium]